MLVFQEKKATAKINGHLAETGFNLVCVVCTDQTTKLDATR